MHVTEDLPLASNDIDVQLLDSAKSGDLETVKVGISCLHVYWYIMITVVCCSLFYIILVFLLLSSVLCIILSAFSRRHSTVQQCGCYAVVEADNSSWSCGQLSWSWRPSLNAAALCRWLQPQNSRRVPSETRCWCTCKGQRVWCSIYFWVLSFESYYNSFISCWFNWLRLC